MKSQIITLLLLFPIFSMAQSKFSISGSAGFLAIKEDSGTNYELSTSYKVSKNVAINLSGLMAELENEDSNIKYDFNKIALTAEYSLTDNKNFGISLNSGFSFVSFDKDLGLDKNNGLGIDLGLKTTMNINKHLDYGFIINSTYSSISPGGILQSNVFLKYRF
jgi:hypothetical protein